MLANATKVFQAISALIEMGLLLVTFLEDLHVLCTSSEHNLQNIAGSDFFVY
jgi:hypothetical protein